MKGLFNKNKRDVWFWIFIGLSVIMLFVMPILSKVAGNSGDEDTWQYPHSVRTYDFYASAGKDTTYKTVPDMNGYGMWVETAETAIIKACSIEDYQSFRHICNTLIGCLAIIFAGLVAAKIAGWRAACITLLLFVFSPRFLGHSFNNPKDIPFAAFFIASLYYIISFIKEYPKPKISTAVLSAIFIGLTIAIRIGGLLLYCYFALFLGIYYLITNKGAYFNRNNLKELGKTIVYFLLIVFLSYLIVIPLWPFILESPINHSLLVFQEMSHYGTSLRQLFEGTLQWSDALPWYYTPKYILMTIPIAVIVGLVLFFIFCWRKKEDRFWAFVVFFTFFFPVFWIVYTHANVYGGWRHAMFAYPPMVVAAGWGFDALLKWAEEKWMVENKEMRNEN